MEINTSKEDADAALKTAIKANTFESLQSALDQYETDASEEIVAKAKRAMSALLRAIEPMTLAEALDAGKENVPARMAGKKRTKRRRRTKRKLTKRRKPTKRRKSKKRRTKRR